MRYRFFAWVIFSHGSHFLTVNQFPPSGKRPKNALDPKMLKKSMIEKRGTALPSIDLDYGNGRRPLQQRPKPFPI
jgi:hypothetical protein